MEGITIGDGLHFGLELCAMTALAVWGFRSGDSVLTKAALGIGVPLIAATLWGVFRVPNDPGPATVAIAGWLRLILEIGILGLSVGSLFALQKNGLAAAFATLIVLDYLLQINRIGRLLNL